MRKIIVEITADVLAVGGFCAFTYGVSLLSIPLAYVISGALATACGIILFIKRT